MVCHLTITVIVYSQAMETIHLILLGLIQGITEFLPVSSSAHLILLPYFMGWPDQGVVYDIAAHLGSLVAVLIYFRKDIQTIIRPWIVCPTAIRIDSEHKLLLYLIFATIPISFVGLFLYDYIVEYLRSPLILALASIFFGLILWWADTKGQQIKSFDRLNYRSVFIFGLAQVLALVPGTSRSGITMTAGLMMGFDRKAAARFSFLMAVPVILLASGHEAYRYFSGVAETDWTAFFIVAIVSAVSALLAIHWFLKFLEKTGMFPYVVYRILLGIVIIVFSYAS